jgi:ATP-dependent DNA helicase RecQ
MPTIPDREELVLRADVALSQMLAAMAGPQAVAHEDQTTAVRALVADRARVLVVEKTGWGKSAVYFAATAALRGLRHGPTLIVSPLLALMRDQVTAATRGGLRARTINSTNVDDWNQIMRDVEGGQVDVLLVSPERLANPTFAKRIGPVIAGAGLVVIDEAHCISDWGFDFRPDYQRLSRVLTAAPGTPVLATTATANARVTADVARQLGPETLVLRGELARRSLHLSVVPGLDALERYAWVDSALHTLQGSGIVYVPTVADTTRLADFLTAQGHSVAAYSGQVETTARERIEDDLKANRVKAVVATSALGMGYDKPDLGFTIHVGSPDSPVAYYQQVGRAGRAIDRAEAILLPAETDERLWEYFATSSIPVPGNVAKVTEALAGGETLSVPRLVDVTGIRKGRLEALMKIMAVDDAVVREGSGWRAGVTSYVFDPVKWDAIVAARRAEANIMRGYARGQGCLMEYLQRSLDDIDPSPCGTCSVCTGEVPAPGRHIDPVRIEAARAQLRGVDVVIEPRKLWPAGLSNGWHGAIVGASAGRALTFADTPGWSDVARLVAGPDQPLPEHVVRGLVTVLSRWKDSWGRRPVAIVAVPSRRHPILINDLAQNLAVAGKLPLIEALQVDGPRPDGGDSSAKRVEGLATALRMRDGAELPAGPVLLVDDSYRTGWTMTVAASLLQQAGASAVLPLVVHQLP